VTVLSTPVAAPTPVEAILEPFQLQTWLWRGHRICYSAVGTGPAVVLVHGFGASIGHWRHNIPVLAAAGYRVYTIDLLGFGGSDKPPSGYSLDLWTELLADFWREQIQTPATFAGNSIGALISLTMVARYPNMAAGGILINCAGGLNHRSQDLNPMAGLVIGTFTKLAGSPLTGPFIFDIIRQRSRIRRTLSQVYFNPAAITDELVEIIYQPTCDPGAYKAFASIVTAPPGSAPEDLLPTLQKPLLVLWGDKDPWTPISRGLMFEQWLPEGIPYTFKPIPNAGHCPHDEVPEVVNRLMLDWLGSFTAPAQSAVSQ
jgi:pimeloyl-ACP methyl ester carboxylesterase